MKSKFLEKFFIILITFSFFEKTTGQDLFSSPEIKDNGLIFKVERKNIQGKEENKSQKEEEFRKKFLNAVKKEEPPVELSGRAKKKKKREEKIDTLSAKDFFKAETSPVAEVKNPAPAEADMTAEFYEQFYEDWDASGVFKKKDDAVLKNVTPLVLYGDASGGSAMPLTSCRVNSHFGQRDGRYHYGTDLDLQKGDPVFAAFGGEVRKVGYDAQGWGNFVVIRHYNGLETLYGHLTMPKVVEFQKVEAGELIGLGGSTGRSTGPHLHFEVRLRGYAVDPELLYDFGNNKLLCKDFEIKPEHFVYSRRKSASAGRVPQRTDDDALIKKFPKIKYHKVRRGDTAQSIALLYGISVSDLLKMNGFSSEVSLRSGWRIRIQ